MALKSRNDIRGARNPNSTLTPEMVLTIRKRYAEGVTQRELCNVYGVSVTAIARIVHRETWGWLKDDESPSPYAPAATEAPLPQASPEEVVASQARLLALLGEPQAAADTPTVSGNLPTDPQS